MNSTIQLNLAVTEDHPFYEAYIGQAERHNMSVDNDPLPNSGFDLFIPCNSDENFKQLC